jgi:hypothetical protein
MARHRRHLLRIALERALAWFGLWSIEPDKASTPKHPRSA